MRSGNILYFITEIILLFRFSKQNCIGIDTTISKECSYCASDYFRPDPYIISGSAFSLSECQPRINTSIERTFYIADGGCGKPTCDGSKESPFPDLITAFFSSSAEANKYTSSKLKFLLVGTTHYILPSSLNSQKGVQFFRRILVDLEISPEKTGDTSTVFLKTDEFHIFVANSLRILNINFIATDLTLKSSTCKEQKTICCSDSMIIQPQNINQCSIGGIALPAQESETSPGLFNMEYAFDSSHPIVPLLLLKNCLFQNINSLGQNTGFLAFINIQNRLPANVVVEGCQFTFTFFAKGLIFSSLVKKTRTYFLIFLNQSFAEIFNSGNEVSSNISIISSTIKDYNKAGVLNSNAYGNLFTVEEISGVFKLKDTTVTSSSVPKTVILLSSRSSASMSDFSIEGSKFGDLIADTLLSSGNNYLIKMKTVELTRNTLQTYFTTFSTVLQISNMAISLGYLPKDNCFAFVDTVIYLNSSYIHDIRALRPNYVLFHSYSTISVSVDNLIENPWENNPAFTTDRILISDSLIENGNFLMLTFENAIYSMEFYSTTVRNLNNSENTEPFINILCEKELVFMNSTFDKLHLRNNFVLGKFGKNLTFFGSTLSNTILYNGFDYFVKAAIVSDQPKIVSNFSHSILYNLTIKRYLDQVIKFFHYNPYSRGYGFYIAYFFNVTIQEIKNFEYSIFDTFMYFAAGNTLFDSCKIFDVSNISIHRFYPRLGDAKVTILSSIYKLYKYKTVLIWLITADYFIKVVKFDNCSIEAYKEFADNNALTFLNIESFVFTNNLVKHIYNSIGNAITVKVQAIVNIIVENNAFFNNTGSNDISADLAIETRESKNIDWESFTTFTDATRYGILNNKFERSSGTGSIFLNDKSEMLLENCTFTGVMSDIASVLKVGQKSTILFRNINILNASATNNAGAFYLINTLIYITNVSVNNCESKYFGGLMMFTKSSKVIVKDSFFDGSTASKGGLFWGQNSELYIINSNINNSKAHIQGGHLFMKDSYFKIVNSNLSSGSSLTSGSIYGEQVVFLIDNTTISNTSTDLSQGLGILYISGIDGNFSKLNNFNCLNNKAMSGSCIYAIDIDLQLVNCRISKNQASRFSIINFIYSTVETKLYMINCILEGNEAPQALIVTQYCYLAIELTVFLNNNVGSYLIYMQQNVFSSKNNKYIYNTTLSPGKYTPCMFWADKLENVIIEKDELSGGGLFSHLVFISVPKATIKNSIFKFGFSSNEAGSAYFSESNVSISSSQFSSNKAVRGGAFYVKNSFLTLDNSNFKSNEASVQGSDIFVVNTKQFNESHSLVASFSLAIANTIFEKIRFTSIYSQIVSISIVQCKYLGDKTISDAITFDTPVRVAIFSTMISGFLGKSAIYAYNDDSTSALLYFKNTSFTDCKTTILDTTSSARGAFFSLNGVFKVAFDSCKFVGGYAAGEGGAISYDCKSPICALVINGTTQFEENESEKSGQVIFTPKTPVLMEKTVVLKSKDERVSIYSIPKSTLIVKDVQSLEALKAEAGSLIKAFIKNNSLGDQAVLLEVKSGNPITCGVILLDDYGSIQETHSNEIFTISSENSSDILDIQNNVATVSEGLALFIDLNIIADSNKVIPFKLSFTYDGITIQRKFNISMIKCSRGEIYYNSRCIKCQSYSYFLKFRPEEFAEQECLRCPDNAECPGGDKIIPFAGFYRLNENSSLIVECKFPEACPEQKKWFSLSEVIYECGLGFSGNLCQNCAAGYGSYQNGCYRCSSDDLQKFLFSLKLILSILAIVYECHIALSSTVSPHKTLIKILFFHTSYLIAITGTKLNISEDIRQIFGQVNNNLSATPADIFNFDCVLTDILDPENIYAGNLVLRLLSILIYSFFAFAAKFLIELIVLIGQKKNKPISRILKRSKANLFVIIFIAFRNMYPRVLLTTIILFRCKDLGGENRFVDDNPDLECWGEEHKRYLFGVTVTGIIIWTFIFQGVTFYYVIKNKSLLKKREVYTKGNLKTLKSKKISSKESVVKTTTNNNWINPDSVDKESLGGLSNRSDGDEGLGGIKRAEIIFFYLTIDYREKVYWWVCFEYLSIFFLMLISQVISDLDDTIKRMIMLVIFCSLYLIYQRVSPFVYVIHGRMVSLSIFACIITITFELIGSQKDSSIFIKDLAKIVILIVNLSFYMLNIYYIVKITIEKKKSQLQGIMVKLGVTSKSTGRDKSMK